MIYYPLPAQILVDTPRWSGRKLFDPETGHRCVMGWVCFAAGMPDEVLSDLGLYSMVKFYGHCIEDFPNELAQQAMMLSGRGNTEENRAELRDYFDLYGMEILFT